MQSLRSALVLLLSNLSEILLCSDGLGEALVIAAARLHATRRPYRTSVSSLDKRKLWEHEAATHGGCVVNAL